MDRNPTIKAMRGDRKAVALRKESVDRNAGGLLGLDSLFASLSARRAWIEIDPVTDKAWALEGRSPQGERG